MVKKKVSEEEVATAVMQHLITEGWDCYPEVLLPGGRADIVAVRDLPFSQGKLVHIIETKTNWSLSLLEQAVNRQGFAHYVSIAAPGIGRGNREINRFFELLCTARGIGIIIVEGVLEPKVELYRIQPAKLCRGLKSAKKFNWGPWKTLAALHPDQKNYTPGTTGKAGYSTPFRRTMDRCVDYVRKHPGCTVKELVGAVESHYARPTGFKQGILMWLEKREEIRVDTSGSVYKFYPIDSTTG